MLIFVITAAAAFAALAAYFYKKFANVLHYGSKFPGPKAYPLVGNATLLLGKTPTEMLQELQRLVGEFGKCFRLWMGTDLLILVSDANIAEIVLSSQHMLDKAKEYAFMGPWLGEGLVTSTGKKWHSRRKLIAPTFHYKILEQFAEIFDRQSTVFVQQLESKTFENSVFDVYPFVALCALDVICESAMGTKVNAQINSNSDYVQAVETMSSVIFHRAFDILARLDITFKFTRHFRMQKEALKVLHAYTDDVIRSRRQDIVQIKETSGETVQNDNVYEGRKKMAFLDMLLQTSNEGKPLTNQDIREEVDTFMFAGHDTATVAISFVLGNLAKHPDVQQEAYDEICRVIGGDFNTPVTLAMLNELNYLDLVIKESLRLYPSVPMIGREMLQNHDINGVIFPAGATVVILPYFMGRNPDYFENPLEFRPERFSQDATAGKSNPYRYVPFSAGPRNCIGQKFAVAEIKSIVSKTLRYYQLLPAGPSTEERLYAEAVLRSENGVPLRLKRRM